MAGGGTGTKIQGGIRRREGKAGSDLASDNSTTRKRLTQTPASSVEAYGVKLACELIWQRPGVRQPFHRVRWVRSEEDQFVFAGIKGKRYPFKSKNRYRLPPRMNTELAKNYRYALERARGQVF